MKFPSYLWKCSRHLVKTKLDIFFFHSKMKSANGNWPQSGIRNATHLNVPVRCAQWHLGNSSEYKLELTFQEDLEMSCKIPSGTVTQPSDRQHCCR